MDLRRLRQSYVQWPRPFWCPFEPITLCVCRRGLAAQSSLLINCLGAFGQDCPNRPSLRKILPMFTYQMRPRGFIWADGKTPVFPGEIEAKFHLRPLYLFGSEKTQGGTTVAADRPFDLVFDVFTGQARPVLGGPMRVSHR